MHALHATHSPLKNFVTAPTMAEIRLQLMDASQDANESYGIGWLASGLNIEKSQYVHVQFTSVGVKTHTARI